VSDPNSFNPVLVTGAAGFIGACATRALVERGFVVHAVHRPGPPPWRLHGVDDSVELHGVDLSHEADVRALVAAIRPRAVVHLAAHGAYESQADFREMVRSNVIATFHLLEASAEVGTRVFVNAGSSSEYGFRAEPMRESDRLEPNSLYAVSKASQTHLCQLFGRRGGDAGGMSVASFRLFSVYGPWEAPTRLLPTLLTRAQAGLPLEMVAPWVARDFVYVDDVLDALLDFETAARANGLVFNLGTGIETNLRQVVDEVLELTGSCSEVRWGAMAPRRWDTNRWVADPSESAHRLDWRPKHTLREGLVKLAAWLSAAGDMHGSQPSRVAG
jgi:UDP-glucose 4-epimerase